MAAAAAIPIHSEFRVGGLTRTEVARALLAACEGGDEAVVQAVLSRRDASSTVNCADQVTLLAPLHLAARRGHAHISELLLDSGAFPNACERHGLTPLLLASQYGHGQVMETLLWQSANPEVRDRASRHPIHLAALCSGPEALEALLKHCRSDAMPRLVDAADGHGRTVLHYALRHPRRQLHVRCLEVLLRHKADVNRVDRLQRPPLWDAVWSENEEAVAQLLEHRADPTLLAKSNQAAPPWSPPSLELAESEPVPLSMFSLRLPRGVLLQEAEVPQQSSVVKPALGLEPAEAVRARVAQLRRPWKDLSYCMPVRDPVDDLKEEQRLLHRIDAEAPQKLLVVGIPAGFMAKDVRRVFRAFGVVVFCDLVSCPEDRDGRHAHGDTSTAIIMYERQYEAETALARMNGFQLGGAALRVLRAEGHLGRSWALATAQHEASRM